MKVVLRYFKYFVRRTRVKKIRVRRKQNSKVSKAEYIKYKDQAKILAENKIAEFNKFYNYNINKITIRNQKTRWGSCSRKGNLNFTYKIALLPEKLVDYIIVHEICHLGEFNHSQNFWDLVGKTIPDYKLLKKELHHHGLTML